MKTREDESLLAIPPTSTRRDFIKHTAGFTFVIGAGGYITACSRSGDSETAMETGAAPATDANPFAPNIWVTVYPDDSIVVRYAGTEMGQGSMTHVPVILAEHLDADWDKVEVDIVKKHDPAYGNPIFQNTLYTAGSTQVLVYGPKMRTAGAQARKMLLNAAAKFWNVAAGELTTEPSVVVHGPSGRRMTFGEIVATAELPTEIPELDDGDFKTDAEFRYIGKQIMRRDVPAKSTGSEHYGIDVQVPGMTYAAVLHAPVEGESPADVDDSTARQVKGVSEIVSLPNAVAVVGDTVEATQKGKKALRVSWTNTSPFRKKNSAAAIEEYSAAAKDLTKTGTEWSKQGDIDGAFSGAKHTVDALYTVDAAYHAQMEPMNATVSVSPDGKSAEIWVGTQSQSLTIMGAAEALGTDISNITLHPLTMGGAYGRRTNLRQEQIDDALFISRAIKKPVKVIWTREDDFQLGNFRTPASQYLRAAFDQDGKITAVHHRVGAPTILPSMNWHRWDAVKPKDVITMLGSENRVYDIPNYFAEHVVTQRCCRVTAFRGVGVGYTQFAKECFIDELAASRNQDPMAFRMELCRNDPRSLKILETVARMADWRSPRKNGRGLGLALATLHSGQCAGVVEISLDRKSGQITVHNIWLAADPGKVISPRNTKAQITGNMIFGLSAALLERIDIRNGEVIQSNFNNHPILRITQLPNIEVEVLSTDNPSSGVGEFGISIPSAAISNAIAGLTGARVRHHPLTPDVVARALAAS
jgi:isoquinoline 1-oxidoreductase subunit beta